VVGGGLFAGYLDVLALEIRRQWVEPLVFAGKHVVWTAPAANLALAALVAIGVLILAAALRRRDAWWIVLWILGWLAGFGALYNFPQIHRVAAILLAAGIATLVTRWGRRREQGFRRTLRLAAPVLALATLVLAGVLTGRERRRERDAIARLPAAREGAPNVLLLVLDTVRAMSLSLYGYHRETTPNLTRWGARGVAFTNAYSTAPWTLPSHASLLTGRWMHELSADWLVPLDATFPTLGEALARAGYRTAGFVANTDYCSAEVGLDRGFAHYEDYTLTIGQILRSAALWRGIARIELIRKVVGTHDALGRKTAPAIGAAFLRWRDRDHRRPYFAMLNYYDAHRPYLPPEPWPRRFTSPGVPLNPRLRKENGSEPNPAPARIQGAIDAYDNAIAYLDHQLGRLLDTLDARGELANTVVIVTSDHGEEFYEHGVWDHGNSLSGPSVRVPLLVVAPGRAPAGNRVATAVSNRDVPATVMDLLGLTDSFPGRSLGVHWREKPEAIGADPVFSGVRQVPRQPISYPVTRGNMGSVVLDSLRYVRHFGDHREELFDPRTDPLERRDLIADPRLRERLPALRALTQGWFPPTS
jgi:arylsulfatase A-like enzyme